ncbi:MAG: tetratricopeptide repeat protein [Desulfobacteraceae bacterium]|jgi:Flp pilus assembly protein TadD
MINKNPHVINFLLLFLIMSGSGFMQKTTASDIISKVEKNTLDLARQLIDKGEYDAALARLNTVLKEKNNISPELFHFMGVCLWEKEEYEQAIENFNRAVALDKEFSFAYNGLGLSYAMTGQVDRARENFKKAISLNPSRADFYNNAGSLEMEQKQYEEAADLFKKSILIDNKFEKSKNNLAICMRKLGKETRALKLSFEDTKTDTTFAQKAIEEELKTDKPVAYPQETGAEPEKPEDIVPDTGQWILTHADDWEIVDEGDIEGPSSWFISADVLKQSSNIYGGEDSGDIPDKPGTYAVAGNIDWTDYSLEVNLLSHDDDAIGVIFRHTDDNNYYRFSMDSYRGYRRLVKKSSGIISVLAEESGDYRKNQQYRVKIIVYGEKILVLLDDKVLFNVIDSDIDRGRIGVYCWGNKGSEFSYPVVRLKPEGE